MTGHESEPSAPQQRVRNLVGTAAAIVGFVSALVSVFGDFEWFFRVAQVLVAAVLIGLAFRIVSHRVGLTRAVSAFAGLALFSALLIVPPWLAWGDCEPPEEVVVLASVEGRAAAEEVTGQYADERGERDWRGCRPVTFTVFAAPELGASEVRELLAAGWPAAPDTWPEAEWPDNALLYGPRPHIWIPDSTADVRMVEAAADDPEILEPQPWTSAWSTPLVLGVPAEREPTAQQTDAQTAYEDFLSGAASGARARPADSTTALLHTDLLYSLPIGNSANIEAEMTGSGLTGTDNYAVLCELRQAVADSSGPDPAETVVFATERAIYDYNTGAELGPDCPVEDETPPQPLSAVHLRNAPWLDHPVVPLDWGDDSASAEVERFVGWLDTNREAPAPAGGAAADACSDIVPRGYRDMNGCVGPGVGGTEGIAEEPFEPEEAPDFATEDAAEDLEGTLRSQEQLRRPVRALLVVDRSDSMQGELPDQRAAFDVATAQAGGLLRHLAHGDEAGLWTFPKGDDRDDTGQQELVEPAPVTDTKGDIEEHLDSLEPDRESTPINDTVLEAALALEEDAGGDAQDSAEPVAFVFTEGVVGSGPGEEGSSVSDVRSAAEDAFDAGATVELIMLDDGGCAAGEPGGALAEIDGVNCSPVDLGNENAVPADRLQTVRVRN
ncbi:hypothetical protein F4561_004817 [Lipingzhangella halophila]|uniref:VWFA domain-containing protein n=1 Tax=Lipingzhangella halophila TaxID=1783352 RepID=A0A7W7RLH3_9ACTN|nr:vWA domain-containing protein [Lipingzhangella halophila]MBB4933997.1 hypothetical protein [Lipingzhangella halophila]